MFYDSGTEYRSRQTRATKEEAKTREGKLISFTFFLAGEYPRNFNEESKLLTRTYVYYIKGAGRYRRQRNRAGATRGRPVREECESCRQRGE